MLGSFELDGIESIHSVEQRALVEHRVPGLAGSYFQDLGTAPNTIVIEGTRHGDDAREDFLQGIRQIFNRGEETTFAADINTATDITDVVVEDLDVVEIAGAPDSFRYVVRLRKYVPPPEPPAVGLPGLDSDLLDQAGQLVDALNTLDALSSMPNLGDPTPPLRGALGGVTMATSGVAPAVGELGTRLGSDPAGPTDGLPTGEALSGTLGGLSGDPAAGTGVGGALAAVQDADVAGRTTSLVSQLDSSLATTVPADGGPGVAAVGRLTEAAGAVPADPATLTAPVSEPLDQIRRLVSPDVASGMLSGLAGLAEARSAVPDEPTSLLAGSSGQLQGVTDALASGHLGTLRQWGEALGTLDTEIAALVASGAGRVEDRLVAFLAERAEGLRHEILPEGAGPAAGLVAAIDAAVSERVAAIQGAASELTAALERARGEFEAGRFTGTDDLAGAEESLRRLAADSSGLAAGLQAALRDPAASQEGLAAALHALHADFGRIEVVDLASPRQAFDGALAELRAAIGSVDLAGASARVEEVFGQIGSAVDQLDLGRLTETLDDAERSIRDALAGLDGAVLEVLALVRATFARVRDALHAVTSALGSVGDDGRFHFTLETEIEGLLNDAGALVRDTIEPALAEFKQAVGDAIGQVTGALQQVTGEIEGVKAQLAGALQGAAEQLRAADVGGIMETVRQTLEDGLSQLGEIDFDPVVDPVVAEIDEARDKLAAIDRASLNEVLRAALSAAVAVISAIDFPHDITGVLMDEFDQLLAVPKDALDELDSRVDAMLARFRELEPQAILEPLSGLFQPLTTALDGFQVEALAAPVEEWHQRAVASLDQVMPETLLAPLVEAHAELTRSFGAISTDSLLGSLRGAVTQIQGDLQRLEPAALAGELGGAVDQARGFLEEISPARLFQPLIAAFDEIARGIDALAPGPLLEPLTRLSGHLAAPLESLTDEDARHAAAAFQPLVGLPAAFDPGENFRIAAAKCAEADALLGNLNLATILAEARARHGAATAALAAGGTQGESLVARVHAVDPVRDPTVAQAVADLQQLRGRFRSAFPTADPPADLVTSYMGIRADVEGLAPEWVRGTPTADAIRQALSSADPTTAIAEGAEGLHTEIRDQWAALDPRRLSGQLEGAYARLTSSLASIDPAAIAGRIQGLVQDLGPRLDALDLDAVAHDAEDLEADVRGVIDALDPQPVIDRLASLSADVKRAVGELNPAELLSELREPLEAAKGVLREFDPASLAEALQPAFAEIESILAQVDLGTVLQPLVDRLEALRTALERALTRTEHSFRDMIAAIPT